MTINQLNHQLSSSEIFHLDEMGYGPRGEFTRREWRKRCLDNLLSGSEEFLLWQNSWILDIDTNLNDKSFESNLTFADGSILKILSSYLTRPYAIDISGHVFESEAFLNNYTFMEVTLFSGVEFRLMAHFGGTKFTKTADFEYVKFCKTAFFENVTFLKNANFDNIFFVDSAHYRKCVFHKNANFMNSVFNNYVDFKETLFKSFVDFTKVKFINSAYFYECIFEQVDGYIEFSNTEFNESLDFHHSKIAGYFSLNKTIIHGNVDFNNTIFNSNTYFTKAIFQGQCLFVNTVFENKCNFENAVFENLGHFEGAVFKKNIPAFRGCKIDATRLEFSDETKFPDNDIEDGTIENVSFLKRLSDEHGQTDQALRFNAIELHSKRLSPNADIGFRTVTWLYEKFSNYGRSFMRPIFWYGVLICLSALFAMIYSTYSDSPAIEEQVLCKPAKDQTPPLKLPYGRAVVEYAMFRAGGLMDFTDTGKQNNAVNCRLFEEPIEPPLMRAWGIFKGIASIALLFLAALGLRNKYRIK